MKTKLKPSWETYSRIIWDKQFNENNFMVGYQDRMAASGSREKPIIEWSSGDIPWNRILYFRCGETIVWDRQKQFDLLGTDQLPEEAFNPVGDQKTRIYSIQNSPFHPKPILHFKNGVWEYWMEQHQSGILSEMNIVTYNILSDEYKQGFTNVSTRLKAVFETIKNCGADIIVLQEVSLNIMRLLMEENWMKEMYISDKANVKHFDSHRTIICSRFPFELYVFDFSKRKQFLVGNWLLNGKSFHLAGLHLSSNRADNAPKVREEQLEKIVCFLDYLEGDYVLAGDFNMRKGEGISFFKKHQLNDIWKTLHPEKEGYTFDTQKNLLADFFSLSKIPGRLDRMLLRLRESNWKAFSMELLGCDAMGNGIYPSDHFGLSARFKFEEKKVIQKSLQHIQPVYQTAIVVVPPEEKWPGIQSLRKKYDSKVDRWMPHITLVYGFLPSEYFEDAAREIMPVVKTISGFPVSLDGYGFFSHRKSVTAWLDPRADELKLLYQKLQGLFPQCRDEIKNANGFNPHLSIGQFETEEVAKNKLPEWKPLDFDVREIALISRKGDEPFRVDCRIQLGTGKVIFSDTKRADDFERNLLLDKLFPEIHSEIQEKRNFARVLLEQACSEELGNPIELNSLGSEKLGTSSVYSDMDLVALIPEQKPKEAFLLGVQQRLAGIYECSRLILDAHVPILKLKIEHVELDLLCCQNSFFPAPIQSVQTKDWHKFDEVSWLAVAGYFEAEHMQAIIGDSAVDMDLFKNFLRCIKAWAKTRGIKGNSIGYLGNYSWTVLVIWICKKINKKEIELQDLLLLFFKELSQYNGNEPIALTEEAKVYKIQERQDRLPIITTVKPYFNSARNITQSTFATIQEEAKKAFLMIQKSSFKWKHLFREINILADFNHKIIFSITEKDMHSMNEFQGKIEGNMVGLMIQLEREFDAFVRPCPEFVQTATGTSFHLGIQLPKGNSINDLSEILEKFGCRFELSRT